MSNLILSDAKAIESYRLIVLKHALKLEVLGMRGSAKINANKIVCKMLGLPARTKKINTLVALEAYIDSNFKNLEEAE